MSAPDSEQKPVNQDASTDPAPREYDTSGIYPAQGKPFRLWALLFWNVVVIVIIAIASAVLNYILL